MMINQRLEEVVPIVRVWTCITKEQHENLYKEFQFKLDVSRLICG